MKNKSIAGILMSVLFTVCLSLFVAPAVAEFANIDISKAAYSVTAYMLAPAVISFAIYKALNFVGITFTIPSNFAFSVPGGTLTCGDLLVIMGKMEALWGDAQVASLYTPEADIVKAILQNQTAKIEPISGLQEKNNTLKITWLNDCDIVASDCTSSCQPTGQQLGIDCKTYSPTICGEAPFSVNEDDLRGTIYSKEEFIARGLMSAGKVLDEKFAAAAVSFLEDSEGLNSYAGDYGTVGGGGAVGNSYTDVAPAYWTASLMGYFMQVARLNKIKNPYVLSGNNLFLQFWNAQAEFANADGKAGLNKFNALPTFFDPFNLSDSAYSAIDGSSKPSSFLIGKSALAFGAKWQYGESPTDYGKEGKRYSIASPSLPGVRYDVHYNISCTSREIIHSFNVISKGGFYLNPVGCVDRNTGVLRFRKTS